MHVAPRDNHILNIDVQVTGETKVAFITVDPSLNDPKDQEVFVPGFEEIPIPDEEEKPEPEAQSKETSLTWASNPDFAPVNLLVDGDNVTVDPQVKLVVNCPRKISSFVINVSPVIFLRLKSADFFFPSGNHGQSRGLHTSTG